MTDNGVRIAGSRAYAALTSKDQAARAANGSCGQEALKNRKSEQDWKSNKDGYSGIATLSPGCP
jgi:hypothetical protein